MADSYDVGDLAKISAEFTDTSGIAINPSGVYFTYIDPSNNTTALVYGVDAALVRSATGSYYVNINVDEAGVWTYRWWSTGTGQASEYGAFTATSSWTYALLTALKTRLGIGDLEDDAALKGALMAASAAVDQYCNRKFAVGAAGTVRYYTAVETHRLRIDDVVSISALVTDADGDRVYETTWAATDYDLEPANAAADSEPYTEICTSPLGNNSFPTTARGIKITGQWGWPKTPMAVQEATLLLAARLWKRVDTPYGLAGSAEFGMTRISASDPDVRALLDPLRNMRAMAL